MKPGKSYVTTVLKKELTDILRDRKTLLTSLLLPLILYPLMFLLMGSAMEGMIGGAEQNTTVAIVANAEVTAYLRDDVLPNLSGVSAVSVDDPYAALEKGDVKLILKSHDTMPPQPGRQLMLLVEYNDKKSDSSTSHDYLLSQLYQYNNLQTEEALRGMGIDLASLSPLKLSSGVVVTASGENGGSGSVGMMLGMLLPMLVVLLLAVGALAPAADMFAGEKERKTMEPLLCTRAGRGQILSGKFLAITVFSLFSVASSIFGMFLGYLFNPSAMMFSAIDSSSSALQLPIGVIFLVVFLVAMMAMTFSGIYASISAYSRTVKEASTYGSYVMLLCYVPIFATMFTQAGDVGFWMMFVPVLNVVGSLKMVLGGLVNYLYLLCAIGSTTVFLTAVLLFARSLFRKESIMLRM